MAYYPNNPNGQATMASSAPVVIASNQSPVAVSGTMLTISGSQVDVKNFPTVQTVNVADVLPGAGANNLGKTNGATVGSSDVGVGNLYKITDNPSIGTVEGKYGIGRMSTNGALFVDVNSGHVIVDELISGSIAVTSMPSITTVSGTVGVKNNGTTLAVSGTITTVSGSMVDVKNFPTVQSVHLRDAGNSLTGIASNPITISGSVVAYTNKSLLSQGFSMTASQNIVEAVANKKIRVYAYKLMLSAALSANFRDGSTSAIEGAQAYAANSGSIESVNPPAYLFSTSTGNALALTISGSGTASGRVSYFIED